MIFIFIAQGGESFLGGPEVPGSSSIVLRTARGTGGALLSSASRRCPARSLCGASLRVASIRGATLRMRRPVRGLLPRRLPRSLPLDSPLLRSQPLHSLPRRSLLQSPGRRDSPPPASTPWVHPLMEPPSVPGVAVLPSPSTCTLGDVSSRSPLLTEPHSVPRATGLPYTGTCASGIMTLCSVRQRSFSTCFRPSLSTAAPPGVTSHPRRVRAPQRLPGGDKR